MAWGYWDGTEPAEDPWVDPGHIYFLWNPNLRRIKIGSTTRSVWERKEEHQRDVGIPLGLLGVRNGGLDLEDRVMDRFEHVNTKNDNGHGYEWHRYDRELLEYATECRVWYGSAAGRLA